VVTRSGKAGLGTEALKRIAPNGDIKLPTFFSRLNTHAHTEKD
jgi:hypothetical protein